ncbi:MAG: MalY/PatB family protein [Clostridiaceae bacterium]
MYDFNKIIERRGTSSTKWDKCKLNGYPEDTLAMWTADMDFEVLPEISEAMRRRIVEHPIYGYSFSIAGQAEEVCRWMKRRHGWDPKPEWVLITPGIVCALKMAVQSFTKRGEAILIQPPVYYPFKSTIEDNGRIVVENPLQLIHGHYEVDFEDFEEKIIQNDVKVFILCNPHNPVGRVFTRTELMRMGEVCLAHDVLVIADEVHADFVFPGSRFIPFLSLDDRFEENAISCTSPSKTFNVAGLKFSNIFIPHREIREKYAKHLELCGISNCNLLGAIGAKAAYEHGDQYVDELVSYIQGNVDFLRNYLAEELPMFAMIEPEGLYLVWIDVSALRLTNEELTHFMIYDAHVWLDEGYIFGKEGKNFERFNLACPRVVIKEAIDRIKAAAINRGIINF